ncbi:unnamed protein product [Caenorhabditis nigoni]
MAHNLLLITLAVSALATVALAGPGGRGGPRGGGPYGHGHGGPPYLANVTREGRKEFEAVFKNETATIAEIDAQTAALAEKYNVSEAYNAFTANHTAHLAAVKANQTQVISNLETVVPKLAAIYQNKDQTRKAQEEAVDALRKEYPVEVAAVKFIRELLGAHDKQGPGPKGGPRGGPRGGPHRGEHGHGRGRGFYRDFGLMISE